MDSVSPADAFATVTALPTSGDETALLIRGEHGVGKTHLLGSIHAEPDVPSVLVRVQRAESRFPLAGFASLLGALRHEPASEFHRYFSLRSEDPDGLFAAAHDLLALIRGLDLPPTIALIDDVGHMDDASRSVLGTIASHLVGSSLWIVATSTDVATVPGFLSARLTRLTTDELVTSTGNQRDADEQTVRILATYAGGNPRILSEQITRLDPDQARGAASLVLPPRATSTIEQVTAGALDVLEPTTREALELIALAPMTHVATLTKVLPDATDDLEDLIDSGTLRRRGQYVTFSDQRLRSRLYWDQGSRSRRENHTRLVEAYNSHDDRLEAWHRSSAVRGPQSVDELLTAAISLLDEGRIGATIEFAERALGRVEHAEDHAGVLIRFCKHLLKEGQLGLADRYSARVRPDATMPEQAMDILNIRLMAQLFHRRHVIDDELLTLADLNSDANPKGACDMLNLGAAYHAERWEIDEGRRLTNRALQLTDSVPRSTAAKVEAMDQILDGLEGRPLEPQRPDEDTDPLALEPDLLLLRARAKSVHEEYQEARQLFTIVMNHPESRHGLRRDLATYGTIRNEISAGEFRMARAAVDAWEAGVPSLTGGTAAAHLIQAWYAYSTGEMDAAEHLIEETLEHASIEASQALRARALALRGTMHVLAGDPEAAVVDLRQVSAASTRFRSPTLLRHWADYTEVCVTTGRVQEAAATVTALERRLSGHRSRWGDLALLRCRALVGTGRDSLQLFDTAVKEFGRDELPYELGRTLRCLAIRQEELGLAVESRRTRMAAVSAFEAAGADAWAIDTDRPATLASPSSTAETRLLDQLTPDEREVAMRVVQGRRNREIAQELYVSVRTVELRLTHIYRTLGVHSRAQLVAALTGAVSSDDGLPPNGA